LSEGDIMLFISEMISKLKKMLIVGKVILRISC